MDGYTAYKIVSHLDASRAEVARLIGVSPTAVQIWKAGGAVSKPVSILLALLDKRPDFLATLREIERSAPSSAPKRRTVNKIA